MKIYFQNKKIRKKLIFLIQFLVFILIIYFFLKNFIFKNYLFYNQYDIFGNLYDIALSKENLEIYNLVQFLTYLFKGHNELEIYRLNGMTILFFNLSSVFIYLKLFNIKTYDKFLILIFFLFLPNFFYRYNYGHITLLYLGYFFLSSYFFICYLKKDKLIYLFSFLVVLLLSIFNSIQYFIYLFAILLINLFYFRKELKKKIIINNLIKFSILIILVNIIFLIIRYDFIISAFTKNNLIYDLEYVNKYSLNSPLDLYVKVDPEVYKLVSKFLKMNNVETYFLKFENYLNFYSINGPENTFFYGPVLLLLSFYFLTINPNSKYLLIFVIMVFLFCLNNFYFFSLLPITKLILPFIRSVTRSLVIVDFIYILLLINFLNHINSKTKFSNIFNTIAIFLLVISITVNYKFGINYNYSDFYISNGTYSNDIKMKLEKKYIENYLSIINPQVTFDNSSPFKLNLNFENDNNKNLYKLNNLFSVEKF